LARVAPWLPSPSRSRYHGSRRPHTYRHTQAALCARLKVNE
jgi:hypothetical protein